MSKNRTSPESNNEEQTNEDSDSVFQQDENAKGVKPSTIISDTTLQDLPMELIECILIKAVAMEVECMKLARSVWEAKADLVISRLGTVCSQWSSIFTTDYFRNELQRTLDRTAQKTIRVEIFQQSPPRTIVFPMTTLKDEIFVTSAERIRDHTTGSRLAGEWRAKYIYAVHVYDRNNMAEVKEVIPLPGICPQGFAACSISNCVYILAGETCFNSVLRITKDDQRQFNISPIISDLWVPNPNLSVTVNGSLILLRGIRSEPLPVISLYYANGFLQHEIRLSLDTTNFLELVPKSNENFVLVSYNDQWQAKLTEIDMHGTILRQYQSLLDPYNAVCHADIYGRLLLYDENNRIEILDSEFNPLDFTCLRLEEEGKVIVPYELHFDSERNEVVAILDDALTIFHLTEE